VIITSTPGQLTQTIFFGRFEPTLATRGCKMVYSQTKNPNLGTFWSALDWKMLIYFTAIWNILQTFGIIYDHLVHLVLIFVYFPVWVSCTKKNLASLLATLP
jgi:hypothetical protein